MEAVAVDAEHLDELAPYWDAAVERSPVVDTFCTSSIWSFAAAASFPEAAPPTVVTDGTSFVGLRRVATADGGRLLVGLDPVWGFASPVVGHPLAAAHLLAARLRLEEFDLALVTGQLEDSVQTAAIANVLEGQLRVLRGPVERRLRADLSAGVDAWWSRRSSRFRQRLRALDRDATAAGVEIVDVSAAAPDSLMDRILAIEGQSWKGKSETGMSTPGLEDFYRRMMWRLAPQDRLRALIAHRDGVDVGFILGGIRDRTYRGLQLSYVQTAAEFGIGHLLQFHQMQSLADSGIETYDLGMDMPYKYRWADRCDETIGLVLTR